MYTSWLHADLERWQKILYPGTFNTSGLCIDSRAKAQLWQWFAKLPSIALGCDPAIKPFHVSPRTPANPLKLSIQFTADCVDVVCRVGALTSKKREQQANCLSWSSLSVQSPVSLHSRTCGLYRSHLFLRHPWMSCPIESTAPPPAICDSLAIPDEEGVVSQGTAEQGKFPPFLK